MQQMWEFEKTKFDRETIPEAIWMQWIEESIDDFVPQRKNNNQQKLKRACSIVEICRSQSLSH